jgi:hypothetical protein
MPSQNFEFQLLLRKNIVINCLLEMQVAGGEARAHKPRHPEP